MPPLLHPYSRYHLPDTILCPNSLNTIKKVPIDSLRANLLPNNSFDTWISLNEPRNPILAMGDIVIEGMEDSLGHFTGAILGGIIKVGPFEGKHLS